MSWLDPFFIGVSNLLVSGTQAVKERGLNLIAGSGVTITAVDNPTSARTDVTITSTGGTGAVPTGTGFYAVVSGVMQTAARAVNLATSDITGILAAVNQAAQTLAGTSVSGTTAAAVVLGVDGQPGGSTASATGAATYVRGSVQTGTASTGGDIHVVPGTGVGQDGNLYIDLGALTGSTSGDYPGAYLTYGGTSQIGLGELYPGAPTVSGMWAALGGAAPTNGNYSFITNAGVSTLNGAGGASLAYAGTNYFFVSSSSIFNLVPIVGGSYAGNSSQYAVHAQVVYAIAGATTLTVAQMGFGRVKFTGTTAATVTLPAVTSDALGVAHDFWNAGSATITLSVAYSGGTSTLALTAGTKQRVWTEYTTGLT